MNSVIDVRKAISKQVGMKPLLLTGGYMECGNIECDATMHSQDRHRFNYCNQCGQKIEWSESNGK